MPKRRASGAGSVWKETKTLQNRTTATYWRAAAVIGFENGKKKTLQIRAKTEREAQRQLTKVLADLQAGLPIDPSKETVAAFLDRWLADSVKHSVRPRTHSSYAMNVRLHIAPEVGTILLRKLAAGDVQRLYARKLESGLSPRTTQYLHAILHRALEQGVKWGQIPRNVCDAVDRPRAARKSMATFTPEEAARFLAAAETDRYHALYVLAVTTGMRQGELLGLQWRDVDLASGALAVRRSLQWNREEKRFELVETKGGRGRNLALSPMAVRALKLHEWRQNGERRAIGDIWEDSWDLVFCTEVGTPVSHANLLSRHFFPLIAKAEVPRIRFHDLRHTAASLLLAAGEHPKVVQEMLGHASITLTLDTYSHVAPSMQKAAASKMQGILQAAAARESV